MEEDLEEFELSADPDTVVSAPEFEGANAARFAVAGMTGPTQGDKRSMDPRALELLGFRRRLLEPSDEVPDNPREALLAEVRYVRRLFDDRRSIDELRIRSWAELALDGFSTARLGFLVAGVSSPLERESVSAAVALWNSVPRDLRNRHESDWPFRGYDDLWYEMWSRYGVRRFRTDRWSTPPFGPARLDPVDLESTEDDGVEPAAWDGSWWNDLCTDYLDQVLRSGYDWFIIEALLILARWRVSLAEHQTTRRLALAARLQPSVTSAAGATATRTVEDPSAPSVRGTLSTMVHGTWGWKGAWWYPRGDFFEHIKSHVRPGLYNGGREFSWSGAYSEKERRTAGERFSRWAAGGNGLHTVFAHSYGGEVVARAINQGASVDEMVLLSAPINGHHDRALGGVRRVIDVRLKFDIVLWLARERQELPAHPKVTRYVIDRAFWHHGASHDPNVWSSERLAGQIGL